MLPEVQQMLKGVSKEQVERREREEPGGRMSRLSLFVEWYLQSLEGTHWSGAHKPASQVDWGVT